MGIELLRFIDVRRAALKFCVPAGAAALLFIAGSVFTTTSTETAVANGDTRTLHLYHTHTHEVIDATFRVDGHYDPAVLQQLNHFLRDWRNNDEINMDPKLFDTLWEVYRTAGATDRIQIYSAYRSPETNAMLRRRSRAVAEHSQHMLGKAMDTTMPGFPMERIREIGMKLQHGGVGWYPSANFVHLDVGGVRSWPRMPYDQLASLFPDGKTVHIASNGQVLPGYEAARAEIAMHGGTEVPPPQESQGFFAWLFGGGSNSAAREDEEDRSTAVATAAPAPAPPVSPQPDPQMEAVAYAQPERPVAPSRAMPLQPERQQVASLEPASEVFERPVLAALPLPPRRPSDLMAETLEVPMPPARPDAPNRVQTASLRFANGAHSDPIGGMIASTASGVPMLRKSQLPAIITRGARSSTPEAALAFAEAVASDGAPAFHSAPLPTPRPAAKPVGLRSLMRSVHKPVAVALAAPKPVGASSGATSGIGPQLTGLRRAARMRAQRASL